VVEESQYEPRVVRSYSERPRTGVRSRIISTIPGRSQLKKINLFNFIPITETNMDPVRNLADVQAVSDGISHSMALTRDGKVFAWGRNRSGQLGDGTRENRSTPVAVLGLEDAISISTGDCHSMALTRDGKVFTWGCDERGQLGNGTGANRSTPVAVPDIEDVISISAGGNHSMALKRDGKVFAWGYNGDGRLGDGTRENRSSPVAVLGLEDVISISGGWSHSMALTRDGKVFAWGGNWHGQLGDGNCWDRSTPVAVPGLKDVISISAGVLHSMALTRDGKVFAWGDNEYGQIEDRSTPVAVPGLEDVISISAGGRHSMALTRDGKVFAWGRNVCGQLGDGTREDRWLTPVAVQDLEDVISIYAGRDHSTALTRDGNVFAWGSNGYGQLGDGTRRYRLTPVAVLGNPEENKWRIGHCRGENQCLISLDDQLNNRKAVYLISPSGGKFAYKTTEILKWLKNHNTNPGSSEVIPNALELVYSLEGVVQYQEDSS